MNFQYDGRPHVMNLFFQKPNFYVKWSVSLSWNALPKVWGLLEADAQPNLVNKELLWPKRKAMISKFSR